MFFLRWRDACAGSRRRGPPQSWLVTLCAVRRSPPATDGAGRGLDQLRRYRPTLIVLRGYSLLARAADNSKEMSPKSKCLSLDQVVQAIPRRQMRVVDGVPWGEEIPVRRLTSVSTH